MACRMDPYPCKTCWDNRKKDPPDGAGRNVRPGNSGCVHKEIGAAVVVVPPGTVGSLSFYTAVAVLGLALVLFVIRKYRRKPATAAGPPDVPGGPPGVPRRPAAGQVSRPNRKGSGKARLMLPSAAVVLAMGTPLFTLFVRSQDVPETPAVSPTAHLEEREAQIYENLRDLQFEFRLGSSQMPTIRSQSRFAARTR